MAKIDGLYVRIDGIMDAGSQIQQDVAIDGSSVELGPQAVAERERLPTWL